MFSAERLRNTRGPSTNTTGSDTKLPAEKTCNVTSPFGSPKIERGTIYWRKINAIDDYLGPPKKIRGV